MWGVVVHWGRLHLGWFHGELPEFFKKGWNFQTAHANGEIAAEAVSPPNIHRCLGFYLQNASDEKYLIIPFWFPTSISAALLLMVWRKTRPKPKGFPVEVQTSKPK